VGDQSEVLLLLAKPKFAYLDADGSGYLGLVQLEEVMESILEAYTPLGKELSEANRADIVRKAVALIDTDSKLDVYQFCNLFNEVSTRVVLMSQSEEKFKALDSDGSGFLEKGELLALAHSLLETGCGFSPTERGQIRQRLEERLNTLNDGPLVLGCLFVYYCCVCLG
jgi:Ca2+-binding EF-hand superfamily protein